MRKPVQMGLLHCAEGKEGSGERGRSEGKRVRQIGLTSPTNKDPLLSPNRILSVQSLTDIGCDFQIDIVAVGVVLPHFHRILRPVLS